MTLILEEEDAMFTGDNVLGHGTAVFEDLATYLKSLEKMRGMFSGRAYPGHGPVIEDGNERIAEYIKHRKLREEQILEVLRSPRSPGATSHENSLGEWDSMEIVKVIYMDVAENLHAAAHGGVMQVLWKLQQEDKVVMNPSTQRWRINNRAAL
jgi:ribonuclease/clavin/mitogillin